MYMYNYVYNYNGAQYGVEWELEETAIVSVLQSTTFPIASLSQDVENVPRIHVHVNMKIVKPCTSREYMYIYMRPTHKQKRFALENLSCDCTYYVTVGAITMQSIHVHVHVVVVSGLCSSKHEAKGMALFQNNATAMSRYNLKITDQS